MPLPIEMGQICCVGQSPRVVEGLISPGCGSSLEFLNVIMFFMHDKRFEFEVIALLSTLSSYLISFLFLFYQFSLIPCLFLKGGSDARSVSGSLFTHRHAQVELMMQTIDYLM